MQQLMASLVFGMSVDDAAYRAGMASARREARRTEQDFDRAGEGMADAIQRSALAVNRATLAMVDSFNSAVSGVKRAGLAMTVGLTLPLGLAGKSAKDTASAFQGAMNKVKAAMLTADPREIEKLRDAALELGPAMGRSSIEAAAAIESLAKNGMSAANILGGGLKSALTLATVGEAELSDAADLTTDIMAQFGKAAGDLPKVVDLVSGALDASKMNFDDYRLAAGNAGGVVGALGYTFEDFNTGLAATAPLFDSGAQAGTSYRAFLTSLVGKSEDARRAMEQLGLEFYETEGANKGAAKSLAAIADQLKTKMGNLSDKSKGAFLNAMFGEDGAQTAVKLIQLGADGIERAQQSINSIRADQKVAVMLDGEAAAARRLAAAWEKLKIGIGEAGLIQVMTAIKNITASVVETIASAPPALFYLINGLGLVAAAAGPVVLGLGALVGIAAPLIVGMGSIGVAGRILVGVLGAIINPVGMLGRGLLFIAARAGAATVVARLSTALASLLGPIGLVITAASILWPMLKGLGEVSAATAKAQEDAARAHGEAEDAISRLSSATGKARVEAIAHVKALRAQHLQQLQTARSALALARAEYLQQKRDDDTARTQTGWNATKASFRSSAAYQWWTGKKDVVGAGKDFVGQGQALLNLISTIQAEDRALAASPLGPKLDLALADPKKTGGKGTDKSTRDTAADEARYQSELGQLRVEMLRATADLTGQARDRYDAEMAAIAEDRAAFIRDNETNDALDKAQRATLLAAKDQALARQRDVAQTDLYTAEVTAAYEQARFANEAAQETVRAQMDLADSVAARREGELRLLKLQKELEAREIAHLLATEREGSDAYARALDRRAGLDALYAGREASARRQTEGPAEGYLRSINLSTDAMREAIQAGGVDALRGLNSELVNAGFNVRKLGDAFANMGNRIVATLAEIAIQQRIIRPMAERLFGEGQSEGTGGWLGSLLKLGNAAASTSASVPTAGGHEALHFGGYRASGGPIQPNKWYMTGEKGPEPFFSGRPGTILSNEALGSVGRRAPAVIQIVGDEGAAFVPRVTSVAGDVSVQTLGRGLRSTARQQGRAARQRLA